MCGIGLTFDTQGKGRATAWAGPLLAHRGPDGEGLVEAEDRDYVLEHRRLAIIDPENPEATQPFADPTGRWLLLYNGELFNFRELRRELEAQGVQFRTNSDTEVVLHSYIQDGRDAFARFCGMFALVIVDRETGEVVAARDQIGVKPLYWAIPDGIFIAASELTTMLAHPRVARALDPAGVIEYLAFGYAMGARTIVKGVNELPPGHLLRIRDSRVEVLEYWDPLAGTEEPPSSLEGELLELLDASVAGSLVSDVPVSLMLSGGLDSATVAALAVRHVDPAELTAYTVSFGLPTDETTAAARLASDLGVRHREIKLAKEELREGFEEWLATMDVPCADPTWIAVSQIARAVHADGGKVLITGDGGDELFGGYNRWMTYLRVHDRLWQHTPAAMKRLGGRAAKPFAHGLAGDLARRAREGGQLFVGSRPWHDDDLARCLGSIGREVADACPPENSVATLRRTFDERLPGGDYLAWMSYLALKTHLVEDYLARLDKMGMRASVEGRVPLLDPGLARWSFTLSQGAKVGRYEQKALFRRVASRVVPAYIAERPKQGFCPPVSDWAAGLMAGRMNGDSPLIDEGIVSPHAVDTLRADGAVGASFALWSLGTLTDWCERNL